KLFADGEEYSEISNTTTAPTKKVAKSSDQQFSLFGGGEETTAADTATESFYKKLETTNHFYQLVQGNLATGLLIKDILKQPSVCFDTETTGVNTLTAELVGMSFSWETGKAFYIPFPENREEAQELINKFIPFFEDENIEKIGQNLKYDLQVLSNYGITVKGKIFDTMIAHYL